VGVSPAGSALLDHRLFLPESWCAASPEARERREKAHIMAKQRFEPTSMPPLHCGMAAA
jgi:hypothetical protein